jgi:ubiquinone/menaquinone biosynthesis C-methylase UbiE
MDLLVARFPLQGKLVIDVGSGTGLSTFQLAGHAATVTGVEIEAAMARVAKASARTLGLANVRFLLGDAERLPLRTDAVDGAIGITLAGCDVRQVAVEMERVVLPGGLVLRVDVAPGWYGGELEPVITGKPRDETAPPGSKDAILAGLGYGALDVFTDQDYGTVEDAVRTYGFIHGQRVIEYLRERDLTTIRWKWRVRFRTVASRYDAPDYSSRMDAAPGLAGGSSEN